jgi:iron complex outermembrane receptor protein
MSHSFVRSFRRSVIGGVALAGLLPALAMAQDAAPGEVDAEPRDEIIVTGTLIRGIAPPGANVVSVTSAAIEQSGATSVAQVLQTIPQLGSFGTLVAPNAASGEVIVNRPNLRSLPGFNTGGGSSTLVLMDGHRMVGVGVASTSPDPDVIPPGVLERIEIVPDGGSAIYGSDAVAGVLNFITIKRFDGVKVDASYGFADRYYQWDANVTAGKDWGSGSIFASYNYAKTDQLVGLDRDYVREFRGPNGYTTLSCGAGNIEAVPSGAVVGLPYNGGTTPVNQGCDSSDFATIYPASERHSVFAGLTQQLDDSLLFELKAYYTNRKTHILGGPNRASAFIAAIPAFVPTSISSPFYGANAFSFAERVYFAWGPNDAQRSNVTVETWGVTPTLTKTFGDNGLRLRVMGNYGESSTRFISTGINGTALNNAIVAGAINPFNLNDPATPNAAAALAQATNFQSFSTGRQRLINARAILDGDLFELPGGTAKFAVGLEYSHEELRTQNGSTVPGFENSGFAASGFIPAIAPLPRYTLSRNVKSAFGELVLPIIGGDGPELTVSLAGRYDDYSDFGDTFNPRIGATFKPVDWISIHGAWGKSFNAPSLADSDLATANTLFQLSGSAAASFAPPAVLTPGTYPTYNGGQIIALRGNKPGIRPQSATTWTLGVDLQPPVVPGLALGVTYYNIDFKDYIGLPPFENVNQLYGNFGSVITTAPSVAVLQAAVNAANVCRDVSSAITCPTITPAFANGVYAYFDARKQNVGAAKVSGLDFNLNYRTETGFGSIFANGNATYTLTFKLRPGNGAFVEQVNFDRSRFRSRVTVGAEIGNLTASATWNHLQGYNLQFPVGYNNPGAGFFQQTSIGSFNTVDLFFRYNFKGEGFDKDLALTLNVNNVFDQDPPLSIATGSGVTAGYANGATLGRLVQVGVSKKF